MVNSASTEFQNFAEAAAPTSPLYGFLSETAALDEELCELFDSVPEAKRQGVLFFAAVHLLALRGASEVLSRAFDSPQAAVGDEAVVEALRVLGREWRSALLELMTNRTVQTNEVNRCMALACALSTISDELGRFIFVDFGTSAGLNLSYEHYAYSLGGRTSGDGSSAVRLFSDVRGALLPPLTSPLPIPAKRMGIDIEPIDPTDDEATEWLRACLWPGDERREQRLRAALDIARTERPAVERVDASVELQRLVGSVAGDDAVVVFSSWVMSWMSPDERARLMASSKELSANRNVWLITLERAGVVSGIQLDDPLQGAPHSLIGLHRFSEKAVESKLLAIAQHHCQWIEWRDADSAFLAQV